MNAQGKAGGITTTKGELTVKTRARSAESDTASLHTMLQWGDYCEIA